MGVFKIKVGLVIASFFVLCSIWHFTMNKNKVSLTITNIPNYKKIPENFLGNQCPSNETDIEKSKIKITMNPTGLKSYVSIESFNSCNFSKTFGGDFWWMKVIGEISFNVPLIDGNNGFYYQDFFMKFEGNYTISLMLEFSNYDGLKDPPKDWFKKGDSQGRRQDESYFGRHYDYILKTKSFQFSVSKGILPADDEQLQNWHVQPFCVVNNAHGYWRNDTYVTVNAKIDSISKHQMILRNLAQKSKQNPDNKKTIWLYGDSLTRNFLLDTMKLTPICEDFNCQLTYTWTYPLADMNPYAQPFDGKDFNENKFLNHIKEVFMNPSLMNNDSVFIINFGLHILKNVNMSQAERLLNGFIEIVNEIKLSRLATFPKVIWKTTTPAYIENFLKKEGMNNLERYLIKQRAIVWNLFCLKKLCENNIPVLDVFWMAASFPQGPHDAVHYFAHVFTSAALFLEQILK